MSSSIEIFLRTSGDIYTLSNLISDFSGTAIKQTSDRGSIDFTGIVCGLDLRVYAATDFEDDLGIPFSRFNYVVSITPTGNLLQDFKEPWPEAFSLVLDKHLSTWLECESIVVKNMQCLVQSATVLSVKR